MTLYTEREVGGVAPRPSRVWGGVVLSPVGAPTVVLSLWMPRVPDSGTGRSGSSRGSPGPRAGPEVCV